MQCIPGICLLCGTGIARQFKHGIDIGIITYIGNGFCSKSGIGTCLNKVELPLIHKYS